MRTALWRRSISRYVIPHLPGAWNLAGGLLYQEPIGWLLRCVYLNNSRFSAAFRVGRNIQLLARPNEHITGHLRDLGHGTPGRRSYWQAPANVTDAEPAMQEILELILTEALPHFDRVGTLPGYTAEAQHWVQRSPANVHYQEDLFCLQLIQGDIDAALQTADAVDHGAQVDGRGWAFDVAARVRRTAELVHQDPTAAIPMMRTQAEQTRANLGLPPPSQADPLP